MRALVFLAMAPGLGTFASPGKAISVSIQMQRGFASEPVLAAGTFSPVPFDPLSAVIIITALVMILSWLAVVLSLENRTLLRRVAKPAPKSRTQSDSTPSVLKLSEEVERIRTLLERAGSNLEGFRLDLEDYGAKSWQVEKESREDYFRMASSLFLLLDHLGRLVTGEKKSPEIDWVYGKTSRILEDEGIEEIPVKRADRFSGAYHKQVGNRPDELPKGAVLEVARRGYYRRGQTREEDVVLRPAEVVVSSGSPEEGPESVATGEAGK